MEFEPEFSPEDFTFTVIGNDPSPEEFAGSANCVDVTIGQGEYTVSETTVPEADLAKERRQVAQEQEELKMVQQQRGDMLLRKRHERYQKLKEYKELQDTMERGEVEQTNKLWRILYMAKYSNNERQTVEPIPDKPGDVKLTITASNDEEMDWDRRSRYYS